MIKYRDPPYYSSKKLNHLHLSLASLGTSLPCAEVHSNPREKRIPFPICNFQIIVVIHHSLYVSTELAHPLKLTKRLRYYNPLAWVPFFRMFLHPFAKNILYRQYVCQFFCYFPQKLYGPITTFFASNSSTAFSSSTFFSPLVPSSCTAFPVSCQP